MGLLPCFGGSFGVAIHLDRYAPAFPFFSFLGSSSLDGLVGSFFSITTSNASFFAFLVDCFFAFGFFSTTGSGSFFVSVSNAWSESESITARFFFPGLLAFTGVSELVLFFDSCFSGFTDSFVMALTGVDGSDVQSIISSFVTFRVLLSLSSAGAGLFCFDPFPYMMTSVISRYK